jgi:YD repeat-containing protein
VSIGSPPAAPDTETGTDTDTGADMDTGTDTGTDTDTGADTGTDEAVCNTLAMYAGCASDVAYAFPGGTATGTMTWDEQGNKLEEDRIDDATGEVVRVASTYTDGRLATQVTTRNGVALADWTYTYDAEGVLVSAYDAAQNQAYVYTYDAEGRLIERGTDYGNDASVDYRCTLAWTDGAEGGTSSLETCDNGSTIAKVQPFNG